MTSLVCWGYHSATASRLSRHHRRRVPGCGSCCSTYSAMVLMLTMHNGECTVHYMNGSYLKWQKRVLHRPDGGGGGGGRVGDDWAWGQSRVIPSMYLHYHRIICQRLDTVQESRTNTCVLGLASLNTHRSLAPPTACHRRILSTPSELVWFMSFSSWRRNTWLYVRDVTSLLSHDEGQ